VRRGGPLYKVNGQPIRLMYGRTPMYRALTSLMWSSRVAAAERGVLFTPRIVEVTEGHRGERR
jgi:hypothetical protein